MATNVSCILLGAGSSTRFKNSINKINVKINNEYPLDILLRRISKLKSINEIVIVGNPHSNFNVPSTIRYVKVEGDSTRILSIKNGIDALRNRDNVVILHDIARPLADAQLFENLHHSCILHDASGIYLPLSNSVLECENATMISSIQRSKHVQSVTPQAFKYGCLKNIGDSITPEDFEETELLKLHMKYNQTFPKLILGNQSVHKLTYLEDYHLLASYEKIYNKTVIITGITGCIGSRLLEKLSMFDFNFVFIVRDVEKCKQLLQKYPNIKATIVFCDIALIDSITTMVQTIKMMNISIDYFLLLHGSISFQNTMTMKRDEIMDIININYANNVFLINELLTFSNEHSIIVNISSSSIYNSRPNQQIYSSSKIAFHNYIEGLRFDYSNKSFYNIVPRRCNSDSRKACNDTTSATTSDTTSLDLGDVSDSIINILLTINNKLMNGHHFDLK